MNAADHKEAVESLVALARQHFRNLPTDLAATWIAERTPLSNVRAALLDLAAAASDAAVVSNCKHTGAARR